MEKILIVDDSIVQAAQLKSIIEDEYDITVAQTAEDGLRLASEGIFPHSAGCRDAWNGRFYAAENVAGANRDSKHPGHLDYQPCRCDE